MKTRTLTLVSFALLATILLGAFAFNVLSAKELKLKCKWKPASYTADTWFPDPWLAEIYFAPPQPISLINPSTILLENTYSPSGAAYPHPLKDRLVVPFYGGDVVAALMAKAPHMSPGTYIVYLEMTGDTYDGRTFRGTGSINMTIPELPPP